MSSKILYITYIDFGKMTSGSAVRPQRMYQAFREIGAEVTLLSGSQELSNKEERKKNVEQISRWLEENRPDFCYIEPPTYPILYRFDYQLIRKVHRMGIPTGYFFRDAYYKLGKEFYSGQNRSLQRKIRDLYLRIKYAGNERLVRKNVDIVYFPSMTMASYFSYRDMRALPPAGENNLCNSKKPDHRTGIYVGGVSPAYGTDIMLEAYRILNEAPNEKKYPLLLVCRESELHHIPEQDRQSAWLKIIHASGEQLKEYYQMASIALVPRQKSVYNDLSVSVKVFEYMGFGLPMVACNSKEMAALIMRYQMGIVTDFTAEDFARGIRALLDDPKTYDACVQNVEKALLAENLWVHRAKTIKQDLLSLENL